MRTVHTFAALGVAASALALTGCVPFVPTGPVKSEDRAIDAVTTVVLDGSGELTISEGEPSLVVTAPEDALDRITTDVEGDRLVLGEESGFSFGMTRVTYELTLPDLETIELTGSGDVESTVSAAGTVRLDLEGSGDVEWSDLEADRVEIRLSGSGEVTVTGETGELDIELDGSGSVDAEDLRATDAVVSVGGSGDVDVAAEESLDVDVSGSGRVTYSGNPSVNSNVSGSGEVVQR
ncbi:head GIN domain-containing protein [Microbacterium sp. NPDC019599]|uniref:head GIN domain-containing protein n=1 Tax=Microbacterium sp. NPDC019599 TaxID=3154690 RepID=UPI003411AF77